MAKATERGNAGFEPLPQCYRYAGEGYILPISACSFCQGFMPREESDGALLRETSGGGQGDKSTEKRQVAVYKFPAPAACDQCRLYDEKNNACSGKVSDPWLKGLSASGRGDGCPLEFEAAADSE